jgi:hypothetical protein
MESSTAGAAKSGEVSGMAYARTAILRRGPRDRDSSRRFMRTETGADAAETRMNGEAT